MCWIKACRLRTLPLALACISMGGFLAASINRFNTPIFILCCLTTLLLQILSNLANDYGDSIHGADHAGRQGPARMVQSGAISPAAMRVAIFLAGGLCLISGLSLLTIALGNDLHNWLIFLGLGLLSILAAPAYTMGKKPYGYAGLGDLSVLLFFGFTGVAGTFYLLTKSWNWTLIFPALSCGLFSAGVLNINNLRDLVSDREAGKNTIPVRFGKAAGIGYHLALLTTGFLCAAAYMSLHFYSYFQWIFLFSLPLFIMNGRQVWKGKALDPLLRQLALSTLLFVILFGVGLVFF